MLALIMELLLQVSTAVCRFAAMMVVCCNVLYTGACLFPCTFRVHSWSSVSTHGDRRFRDSSSAMQ